MKRIAMAALLLMTCGTTACGISEKRLDFAGTDPTILLQCPRSVSSPGALAERHPVALPDGRMAILVDEADVRENMLVAGALVFKRAWTECRSVVVYVEDRDAKLKK